MLNKKTSLVTMVLLIEKRVSVKKSLALERYLPGTAFAEKEGCLGLTTETTGNDQDDPVDTGSSFIEILYSA
jgi:hypothetical protein